MQITETNSDGLKREIQVVLAAGDLTERCDKRLDEIKDDVQLKGFRKGKVPKLHLKKVFGRRLMLEVLQEAVEESSKQALTDRNERPVSQPEITLPEDQLEIESVVSGAKDLAFSMSYEVIPPIELVDFSTLEIERLKTEVDDTALNEALQDLAKRNTVYAPDEAAAAEDGDKLKIDFVGKIDGEVFEGGTAEGIDLVMGQGGFIPGFEDGLKGAKTNEERVVNVSFPDDYPVDTLKGKAAVFDVTVKEVGKPAEAEINDALAEALGVENLDKLKELVSNQIASEYEQVSRARLKRTLLDLLDEKHSFELPKTLVEAELKGIWDELNENMKKEEKTFEDTGKTEDETRAEYTDIAERRVRLGLVIGEIGDKHDIQVEQDELREAMVQQARQYPGQEKAVYEYFEKTPGAIGQLRAPIFEEKVVDFLVEKANVTDRDVSREDLLKPLEEDAEGATATAAESPADDKSSPEN
ncbi:MAG: trigger factor [Hyphomicrobiaceae bacterium]